MQISLCHVTLNPIHCFSKTHSFAVRYHSCLSLTILQDNVVPTAKLGESRQLHDTVHTLASRWFESIEPMTKRRILSHYGHMPSVEGEYWTLSNGPAWMWWIVAILPLDPRIQVCIASLSVVW